MNLIPNEEIQQRVERSAEPYRATSQTTDAQNKGPLTKNVYQEDDEASFTYSSLKAKIAQSRSETNLYNSVHQDNQS